MNWMKTLQALILVLCAMGVDMPLSAQTNPERSYRQLQQDLAQTLASGGDPVDLLRQLQSEPGLIVPMRDAPAGVSEFKSSLAGLHSHLQRILRQQSLEPADLEALSVRYQYLQAARLLLKESFGVVGETLEKAAMPQLSPRLSEAQANHQGRLAGMFELFDPIMTIIAQSSDLDALVSDKSFLVELKQAGHDLLYKIDQLQIRADPRILGNTFLPYRSMTLSPHALDTTTQVQPSYLSPDELPGAADLVGTIDAPLAPEILVQAEALGNDYIRIYEFVKNNIHTEWYVGSMKGAIGTLRQRRGNDVDQANLLIALFRASGLSSRYVHGVIELSIDAIKDSLGLSDAAQVIKVLSLAGIAHSPVVRGGQIEAVNIAHSWVSAYVPYTNYRGALVDTSGSIWLPLMPALKNYDVQASSDIFQQANLVTDDLIEGYLEKPQSKDLQTQIVTKVGDYLLENQGGVSLDSQLGSIEIKAESLGLLPNTVPVSVVAVNAESPVLNDQQRHRIRIVIRGGVSELDEVVLDYSSTLSGLASERVTLSYVGASVDDQKTINLFGGLDRVPAYLVKLRPQIKVNGRQAAVGSASLDTGILHRFDIELISPTGTERIEQSVISGSYHALAIAAGDVAQNIVTDDPGDTEYLGASLLSRLAYDYSRQWYDAEQTLSGLLNLVVLRPLPSIAVVSNDMHVDSVLGLPSQISWQAVTLDAAMRIAQPISRSGDNLAEKDFMRLTALQGSSLEHSIFETLLLVESISADKGLQLARQQGIEVLDLNSGNFSTERVRMTHPANVATEIENWVGLGYQVTTPISAVSHNQWQGHVWQVEETNDGSGGYFIAGGLAGGSSSQAADSWVLDWMRDALAASNTPPPNLNPGEAAYISILSNSDGQTGIVGESLGTPLSVMVLDASNKPVQGASVNFRVISGGGEISDVTPTDQFGVATATLTLGEKTSADPVYVRQNASDKYVTQAGLNVVDAYLSSSFGVVRTVQPFIAIGYPDEPTKLVINNPDQFVLGRVALSESIFMGVQAQDQFGNSVSNVSINFSADSITRVDNCDTKTAATVDDNGGTDTDVTGASATLIAGAGYRKYKLTANGIGASVSLEVSPFGCSSCSKVVYEHQITISASGKILTAAKAGEKVASTGKVFLVDEVGVQKTSSRLKVSHNALTTGASISNERNREATYNYDLRTSSSPGFNAVEAEISGWVEAIREDGNDACLIVTPQDRVTPLRSWAGGAPGLILEVTRVISTDVPGGGQPAFVFVDAGNRSIYPTEIQINVQPAEYESALRSLNIYQDGALIAVKPSDTLAGAGSVILPPGISFDPERNYEAELVINRGSTFELKSERVPIPIRTDLIQSYSRQVVVQQQIDILNKLSCNIDSAFNFNISEAARVTLVFADETNPSATTRLVDNKPYSSGESEISITVSDLSPGRYAFTLTAVADADGYTETRKGFALVEFKATNNLPVGHTIVKGVDVYDGNLSIGSEELSLPGRGIPLAFNRSYSSNAGSTPGPLGVGWHHPYNSKIELTRCGEAIVVGGAGGGMRFVNDGNGKLKPLRGYHGSLIQNESNRSFDFYAVDGTRYHYTNFGRSNWDLEFIEDTNGNLTKLGYDPSSHSEAKLITVEDSVGRRLQFTYQNRLFNGDYESVSVITLLEAVDSQGNLLISIAYEYDEHGNLVCAAREAEHEYDSEDRLLCSNRGDEARVEIYDYETDVTLPIHERHKMTGYTDANGNQTIYEHEPRTLTLAIGSESTYVPYSSVKRVDEPPARAGGGRTITKFSYDFTQRDTMLTNARGFDNGFHMIEYGSVDRLEKPSGTILTNWTPDDVLPMDSTDANQVRSDFSYDQHGNMLSETVAGTHAVREFSYRAFDNGTIKNRPRTRQDRDGRTTTFTYDDVGNLTHVTDPEGGVTVHGYNSIGDKRSTRDANGNITQFNYDEYGNISDTIDALGQTTKTEWNAKGLPVNVTDALGRVTEYEYDTLNRLMLTRNAAGGERFFSYDANGN
ncbi:MAG: hypothetical protein GY785_07030, partial [Gammaproteobacteria bacterium]|nr:hypothetical protein [Gammaproteobacteria bacterium]